MKDEKTQKARVPNMKHVASFVEHPPEDLRAFFGDPYLKHRTDFRQREVRALYLTNWRAGFPRVDGLGHLLIEQAHCGFSCIAKMRCQQQFATGYQVCVQKRVRDGDRFGVKDIQPGRRRSPGAQARNQCSGIYKPCP